MHQQSNVLVPLPLKEGSFTFKCAGAYTHVFCEEKFLVWRSQRVLVHR